MFYKKVISQSRTAEFGSRFFKFVKKAKDWNEKIIFKTTELGSEFAEKAKDRSQTIASRIAFYFTHSEDFSELLESKISGMQAVILTGLIKMLNIPVLGKIKPRFEPWLRQQQWQNFEREIQRIIAHLPQIFKDSVVFKKMLHALAAAGITGARLEHVAIIFSRKGITYNENMQNALISLQEAGMRVDGNVVDILNLKMVAVPVYIRALCRLYRLGMKEKDVVYMRELVKTLWAAWEKIQDKESFYNDFFVILVVQKCQEIQHRNRKLYDADAVSFIEQSASRISEIASSRSSNKPQ